jgi:alkyl hydroperoxide reductase subunit F
MAVPMVFLNGQPFGSGRMDAGRNRRQARHRRRRRDAAKLSAKEAVRRADRRRWPGRRCRCGVRRAQGHSHRRGRRALWRPGQRHAGIENYISVLETDGPKFAAALEAHTRAYDVDIMNLQRADKLIPAAEPGGLIEVKLANGGSLKAKTVILSTGARWRNVNVPGEAEYKNKGVAYCPHCDGPLFKGKRVAVIGGGNSGVEAAIDLAGVVATSR